MQEVMNNNTEVSIIENSMEILQGLGDTLRMNIERANKAEETGRNIIAAIATNGNKLNPELDARCNKYLANCAKATREMEEARKPGTQIMDEIKKMFTGAENKLSAKSATTPAGIIQGYRNAYAKMVAEEEARKRKEADLAAQKSSEAINIKAEGLKRLTNYFLTYLSGRKEWLVDRFNTMTLETFKDMQDNFQTYDPVYPYTHHTEFKHSLVGFLYSVPEIDALLKPEIEAKFKEYSLQYKDEMLSLRDELLSKFPSKKDELEEQERLRVERERLAEEQRIRDEKIAKANAEERERLAEEQRIAEEKAAAAKAEEDRINKERQLREEEERLSREKEAAEKQREADLNNEMNKNADLTATLFEKEAAIAQSVEAPETRTGYEIEIKAKAAWMLIFQYWFENEGKGLTDEKIGKTSLAQMKAYCEKAAHKSGTKIENQYIVYNPTYKAVNRKAQ